MNLPSKAFKPAGHNSVSPYLVVEGAQELIDFLIAAGRKCRLSNTSRTPRHAGGAGSDVGSGTQTLQTALPDKS